MCSLSQVKQIWKQPKLQSWGFKIIVHKFTYYIKSVGRIAQLSELWVTHINCPFWLAEPVHSRFTGLHRRVNRRQMSSKVFGFTLIYVYWATCKMASSSAHQRRSRKRYGIFCQVAAGFPDSKLLRWQRLSCYFLLEPWDLPEIWDAFSNYISSRQF